MSLPLPPLYHWSPTEARDRITRRGLRPSCHTVDHRPYPNWHEGVWEIGATFKAVCLGTSPSHAWSLSGAVMADRAESWDLWQVTLDDGDEVHPMPFDGYRLSEFRVANPIPKSRCWLVGTRVVGSRPWNVAKD